MFSDSKSSGSLIVCGISEYLFSNASLYKEQELFQILLILPVGGKLQGACIRAELLTADCEANATSISTQLFLSTLDVEFLPLLKGIPIH